MIPVPKEKSYLATVCKKNYVKHLDRPLRGPKPIHTMILLAQPIHISNILREILKHVVDARRRIQSNFEHNQLPNALRGKNTKVLTPQGAN